MKLFLTIMTLEVLVNGMGEYTSILYLLKMAEKIGNSHVVLGFQHENYEWRRIKGVVFEHFCMSEYDFEKIEDVVMHKLVETV